MRWWLIAGAVWAGASVLLLVFMHCAARQNRASDEASEREIRRILDEDWESSVRRLLNEPWEGK